MKTKSEIERKIADLQNRMEGVQETQDRCGYVMFRAEAIESYKNQIDLLKWVISRKRT